MPPSDKEAPAVLGETLAEAFVRRVLKTPDDVAAADRLSGVLSYRKLYVGARLMAKRFRQLQSAPLPGKGPRDGTSHAQKTGNVAHPCNLTRNAMAI